MDIAIASVEDPYNLDFESVIDNYNYNAQECSGNDDDTSETIYPTLQFLPTAEYLDPGTYLVTNHVVYTEPSTLVKVPLPIYNDQVIGVTGSKKNDSKTMVPKGKLDIVWMKKGSPAVRPDSGYGSSSSSGQHGYCMVELQMFGNSEKSRMAKVPVNTTYGDIWVELHKKARNLQTEGEYQLYRGKHLLSDVLGQCVDKDQCIVVRPKP